MPRLTARTLKAAWGHVVGEFKERADWHLSICETIKKSICDVLPSFAEQQRKLHKTHQATVDKACKTLQDLNALVAKVSAPRGLT